MRDPLVEPLAMRALVKELRRRERAAPERVASAASAAPARVASAPERKPAANAAEHAPARGDSAGPASDAPARVTRYIPRPVLRGVWVRDDARCAFRDERGERCRETSGLEVHHRKAFALGGSPTRENLELRCRAHNLLAAEEDFGREHMAWRRGVDGDAPAREQA